MPIMWKRVSWGTVAAYAAGALLAEMYFAWREARATERSIGAAAEWLGIAAARGDRPREAPQAPRTAVGGEGNDAG